jgi:hypothetical protein
MNEMNEMNEQKEKEINYLDKSKEGMMLYTTLPEMLACLT